MQPGSDGNTPTGSGTVTGSNSSDSSFSTSSGGRPGTETGSLKPSVADTVPGGWAVSPPKRTTPTNILVAGSSDRIATDADRTASDPVVAYKNDPNLRLREMRKSRDLMKQSSRNSTGLLKGPHTDVNVAKTKSGQAGRNSTGSVGTRRVRRKALLIGVTYSKTRGSLLLPGSVNDTRLMYRMLVERFGIKDEGVWVLTDEPIEVGDRVRQFQPTRSNIMNGHGGQVRDTNGDELDGWDETLLPSDYPTAGQIVDDDLHKIMVRGLPTGARLTAVVDTSNSGTILDLPFVYGPLGGELANVLGMSETRIRARAKRTSADEKGMSSPKTAYSKLIKPITSQLQKRRQAHVDMLNFAENLQRKVALSIKDCGRSVSFSFAGDPRSAENFSRGARVSNGTMAQAFTSAIYNSQLGSPECTFESVLQSIREELRRQGHAKPPQLGSSHDGVLTSQFEM